MKKTEVKPTLVSEFKGEWKHFAKLFKKVRSKPTADRVHDFRVSSRRLEAYLSLFKGLGKKVDPKLKFGPLEKKIKKLRSELGPLRDFDADLEVMAQQSIKPPTMVEKTILQKRNRQSKKARSFFKTVDLKEQSRLADKIAKSLKKRQITEPLPIRNILKETEDGVLKSLRTSMHKARMKAKKLRYQTEILQKLGHSPKVKLEELKKLQDTVGTLHNTIVLLGMLKKGRLKKHQKETVRLQKALLDQQASLTESSQVAFQEAPWVN